MNLKFDPVDVVGAGCWDAITRVFLFVTAVFIGCGIASWAINVRSLLDEISAPIMYFLIGPVYLLSVWAIIGFPVLIGGCFMMVRTEATLAPRWTGLAIALGLLCMCGYGHADKAWLSWPLWIVLNAMYATATWFFIQWSRNRWIQEMAELKAENEQRRLEIQEKFGTVATNMYNNDET